MFPEFHFETALVHASRGGNTLRVVERLRELLKFSYTEWNDSNAPVVWNSARVLFVSPTCGDEELHPGLEDYLLGVRQNGCEFAICELGNYYGYETKSFGAGRTLQKFLSSNGWREFHPMLSLDSSPAIDWRSLEAWAAGMNTCFRPSKETEWQMQR